jgi:hypothetical protein
LEERKKILKEKREKLEAKAKLEGKKLKKIK